MYKTAKYKTGLSFLTTFLHALPAVISLSICLEVGMPSVAIAETATAKPTPLPWSAFAPAKDKEEKMRSYNFFLGKVDQPKIDTSNPTNWKQFNPDNYSGNKQALVPTPTLGTTVGGLWKYELDLDVPQDPAKNGAVNNGARKIIFAHQGTPTKDGWLAPQAGYAYMVQDTLIFGTTNFTPINYSGQQQNYIGVQLVPLNMYDAKGNKIALDLSRLFFPVNSAMVSHPQSKAWPTVIYLQPGESAEITDAKGQLSKINCPPSNQTKQLNIDTGNGISTAITVMCLPSNAVIPGKVTP